MKKILIVPILLTLIIFSLYHQNVDGISTTKKGYTNVTHEVEIAEKVIEVFNNSKDELKSYLEQNETNETEEKRFSVKILGDLNTTKETTVRLYAEVKNAEEIEKCNYFWYEDKQLISMGAFLEETFPKGEHRITLIVRDANGAETNDSVVVGAYDYYSVKRFNYDPHYGNLLYVENQTMNHKGQYVLYDDGMYSKEYSSYDENNNLTEQTVEYYQNPSENRKMFYTYNDDGQRLTSQTFNADGASVYYVSMTYDDNGTLVSTKRGTSEESLSNDNMAYGTAIYYEDPYASGTKDTKLPEDIIRMNDNGQVVYEERHYYGGYKNINESTYNEDGQLTKTIRRATSAYDTRLDISEYDANGNATKKEYKYKAEGRQPCYYVSHRTYVNYGQTESIVNTLLDGECPYIDEVKRTFTYDSDGTVANIKASTDDDVSSSLKTLEVIKAYTNDLEV